MIPKREKMMLPFLKYIRDGKTYSYGEIDEHLASEFNLTDEEKKRIIPSGGTKFRKEIQFVIFELRKAGLIDTKGTLVTITEDGKEILAQKPPHIDRKLLLSIPKYKEHTDKKSGKKNGPDVNHWKIAPGKQAENWQEQKNAGVIAIRWNELGDLTEKTFEEIHADLKHLWPKSITGITPQFKYFLSIKKGDIIVANKGQKTIVGIGRVLGPYKYRPDLEMHHTYPVDWFDIEEREIPSQGSTWRKTVYKIKAELISEIISNNSPDMQEGFDQKFEELIKIFDRDRYCFKGERNTKYISEEERNQLRNEFISRFPRNKIKNLKLTEYALNNDPETGESNKKNMSYLLEYSLRGFGKISGRARKFGIYFKKDSQDLWYNPKYSSSEDAFNSIKKQLIKILDAGDEFQKDPDWEKLSNVVDDGKVFDIQPNVSSIILAVYYPNTFLSIYTVKYIDKILKHFKIPRTKLRNKLRLKQGKLIDLKNAHPIMKNWTAEDYSYFLWNAVAIDETTKPPKPGELSKIKPLNLPAKKELDKIKAEISKSLLVEGMVVDRIIASLYAGKNVLLTGPVGTGKTDLAQKIPKIVWN
ncbi:MAG: hypothetical protein OXC46_06185, partial [Thaumarchaeota archaeon]|nr:hypothetical protein [Nitrososphaerota archaeon]